ncbi:Set1C PHD Finger protein Spf1 [Schizosaccharomyces cryophilus OY26]|uniref:Set1C PHD Finger protein Spf1 n=1 Tax=Schizosaccharomyces cryophilus (strain OY26 / ATCC MYA-4695 / CBS 11777 / NBRC 106824 / NRRL Y48691) TaxID=653667 RepID=S9X882_SCHCR|nr:Set1C PHD Finger protein Spf1 [Schizosaccharomyces cryophilus OY26]EPY50001.1 Set1C PHD Finger protein Spf1 [Schizosaccharomyces cryophilus OY26]
MVFSSDGNQTSMNVDESERVKIEDSILPIASNQNFQEVGKYDIKDGSIPEPSKVKQEESKSPESSSTETDTELHRLGTTIPKKPTGTVTRKGPRRTKPGIGSSVNADFEGPVYCLCRGPDDGRWMLGCDGCEDWFHGECVNIPESFDELTAQYFCPSCTASGRGLTAWKRKCRLRECSKPAEISSKYCCHEHGVLFMRSKLKNTTIDLSSLKTLTMVADNFQEFRNLGNQAPSLPDTIIPENVYAFEREDLEVLDRNLILLKENLNFTQEKKHFLQLIKDASRVLVQEFKEREGIKKDVCGFDNRLLLNDRDLRDVWHSISPEVPIIEVKQIHSTSDSVCFQEKRRCIKHGNWQIIFTEDLNQEEKNLLHKINQMETAKQRLVDRQRERAILDVEHEGHAEFHRSQLSTDKMMELLR